MFYSYAKFLLKWYEQILNSLNQKLFDGLKSCFSWFCFVQNYRTTGIFKKISRIWEDIKDQQRKTVTFITCYGFSLFLFEGSVNTKDNHHHRIYSDSLPNFHSEEHSFKIKVGDDVTFPCYINNKGR